MNFEYSPLKRELKIIYRKFFPVPKSPWTAGYVKDICEVNLVPHQVLKKFFSDNIKMLQKLRGKDIGDYLEFGVFNGSSIGSMFLASEETGLTKTRFFGFDAFEGLPVGSENEDDGVWKKGFYACSFDKMKECLARRDVDYKKINWVKGWYNKTLNGSLVRKFKISNPGIVFIDCDTYSSSKTVLDFIGPLIDSYTLLCFDDWKLNDLDVKGLGEYKSFNEFLDHNKDIFAKELKSYNRKSKTFLVWRKK